jgi:proteasome lid subunit RPN8/RPN11
VTEARPAKNVSTESRSTQYAIDSDLVRRTEAEFRVGPLRVVGFYHSHPEGAAVPSERDRRRAWPYYVYAIVSVKGTGPSDFKAWRLDDDLQEFVPIGVLLT